MAVIISPASLIPSCNDWSLQDPLTQRYLLKQLLCAVLSSMSSGEVTCDDATAIATYRCQKSPEKLRLLQAQAICTYLDEVDCSPPVCLDPLNLEAEITAVIGQLLNRLSRVEIL